MFHSLAPHLNIAVPPGGTLPHVHDLRHNSGNRIIPATDRQQLYFVENRGIVGT
jgi:hypothetical protein